MPDGYRTVFSLSLLPTTSFWEKEVKPPGVDGGEAVDTTTMRNNKWRTYGARHLKTLTEMTCNVAWDPDVYTQIVNTLINNNAAITVWFPDGSSLSWYGYMVKFDPGEHKEGEMPIASMTLRPTNTDETTAEQSPVLTPAAGT
jgi:hypothetical protein